MTHYIDDESYFSRVNLTIFFLVKRDFLSS